jgi:hypothetical protein
MKSATGVGVQVLQKAPISESFPEVFFGIPGFRIFCYRIRFLEYRWQNLTYIFKNPGFRVKVPQSQTAAVVA